MSSKSELHRILMESSPYGLLFFAYGTCIESNPKAERLLNCERNQLLGTCLDEISGDESTQLLGLKLQIKRALKEDKQRLIWSCSSEDAENQKIELCVKPIDGSTSECLITLMEVAADSVGSKPVFAEESNPKPTQEALEVPESEPIEFLESVASEEQENLQESLSEESIPTLEEIVLPPQSVATSREVTTKSNQLDENFFDPLTQLPNRQYLKQVLDRYLAGTDRSEQIGALLKIDLDEFKDINDSWGHNAGDQVIKRIAAVLSDLILPDDILVRMNGDEYVLFKPGGLVKGPDQLSQTAWQAQQVAEQICEAVATPIFIDGHELVLTASVGIALLSDDELSAERALQFADTAMYEAKRQGRNTVAFFDHSITEKAKRQVGLNIRLRKAIDNQEFALYIQPQVDVNSGRVIGGEVLLRWLNPERSHNMPSEFIPVLEASGLIVQVGHWVIRTACEYLRSFIDQGLWQEGMRLAINISPRQFRDPQLLEVVQHSISSYNIDPRYLNFEITENLLIDDVDQVIEKMNAIKSLGACFSIDDFGIGYSSMIYLKRLPFDHLKIDRVFIRNIPFDPESYGVVEAIMAVSRQYGLHVVAEGVEDVDALTLLSKVGCDSYQGAYYSMPVPVDRFRELLVA
ncbi:bifunctional diguanylate cyclase/phosphodiesterase [Porticoccaceae bacterium LTM1]|nr:bifunctional diguanylate cyclase/phosphodiesterase [Porticoccaceae bacterium LTM1]